MAVKTSQSAIEWLHVKLGILDGFGALTAQFAFAVTLEILLACKYTNWDEITNAEAKAGHLEATVRSTL
jgi:hypothetical protein